MPYYWTINSNGFRTSPVFDTEKEAEAWKLLYKQYGIDAVHNPEDIPGVVTDRIEDSVFVAIWDYEWNN